MAHIESWDDDVDFDGDLFGTSTQSFSTVPSLSSRMSVRSESNAGDSEDWQVLVTPNDKASTLSAISSAKQAGIPIPNNVPQSALLGGTIKRLGKKKTSRQNIDDDWGNDLELPSAGGLKLKTALSLVTPSTPSHSQDEDNWDDSWAEGSLGIRFAGTKRGDDYRNRSSSVSAMSPSLNSCITIESEEDGLGGLVIPDEPLDFDAILKRRKDFLVDDDLPGSSPTPAPTSYPSQLQQERPERRIITSAPHVENDDDFFADLDVGSGEVFDKKKLTLNRNITVKDKKSSSSLRAATTLTFTDKPVASRIPRPMPSRSKLDPIHESTADKQSRFPRAPNTTTSAQLLRAKRSAPALRHTVVDNAPKPPVPFLPAGLTSARSHHIAARTSSHHLRSDSDSRRPMSPPFRTHSRLSTAHAVPETPSRTLKRGAASHSSLAQEAAKKTNLTLPARRRKFGDGNELEIFDDLPTSTVKESQFVKQPIARGPPKALRHKASAPSQLSFADRMAGRSGPSDRSAVQTPMPPITPATPFSTVSTPRGGPIPPRFPTGNTPSFARDTAASRIAREQNLSRLGMRERPRSEGPLTATSVNWKAQIAARSPYNSPQAKKKEPSKRPMLITQKSHPTQSRTESGMTYNPIYQRWEGNENALTRFNNPSTSTLALHTPTPSNHTITFSVPHPQPATNVSPPRVPALISHVSTNRSVRVEKGMLYDPQAMKWVKATDTFSPDASEQDEEDPFAGLEDLPDEKSKIQPGLGGVHLTPSSGFDEDVGMMEEFDVGPNFIRREEREEAIWRKRVEGWMRLDDKNPAADNWKWAIRAHISHMPPVPRFR